MSDLELRLAERDYAESKSTPAFERLQVALVRAGKLQLCPECREEPATTTDGGNDPSCLPCRESSLEHGHRHGLHVDLDSSNADDAKCLAECPRCRAPERITPTCPACGLLEATVEVDYVSDDSTFSTEWICEVCAEERAA